MVFILTFLATTQISAREKDSSQIFHSIKTKSNKTNFLVFSFLFQKSSGIILESFFAKTFIVSARRVLNKTFGSFFLVFNLSNSILSIIFENPPLNFLLKLMLFSFVFSKFLRFSFQNSDGFYFGLLCYHTNYCKRKRFVSAI